MHIFPYSERTGTLASKMAGAVDKTVVKLREKQLQELNSKFKKDFYEKNINTIHKVLIEENANGYSLGYTENYIYTYIEGTHKVCEIVDIKLNNIYNEGMRGEILKK